MALAKARDDGRHELVKKPKRELKSFTDARKMTPSVMTALLASSLDRFRSKALRKVVIAVVSKDQGWSSHRSYYNMYNNSARGQDREFYDKAKSEDDSSRFMLLPST